MTLIWIRVVLSMLTTLTLFGSVLIVMVAAE